MKVTRLKPLRRHAGHVAVFVDGSRLGVLPVEDVRALGLVEGMWLNAEQQETLSAATERQRAYDVAVRLLAARGRSIAELRTRLRRRGLVDDAIRHAIGRLEREAVLDDAAFARHYARAKADRGYGRARILADLAARGVSPGVAQSAAMEALEEDWEAAQARLRSLARKRARQLRVADPEVLKRRLAHFLQRRGFPASDVLAAVREVISEGAGRPDPAEEPGPGPSP